MQKTKDGAWTKTGAPVRLVTMASATQAIPSEKFHDQISLDADHSGMVKFNNEYDSKYVSVLVRLKECVENSCTASTALVALRETNSMY
jgi:hypothetical protein